MRKKSLKQLLKLEGQKGQSGIGDSPQLFAYEPLVKGYDFADLHQGRLRQTGLLLIVGGKQMIRGGGPPRNLRSNGDQNDIKVLAVEGIGGNYKGRAHFGGGQVREGKRNENHFPSPKGGHKCRLGGCSRKRRTVRRLSSAACLPTTGEAKQANPKAIFVFARVLENEGPFPTSSASCRVSVTLPRGNIKVPAHFSIDRDGRAAP